MRWSVDVHAQGTPDIPGRVRLINGNSPYATQAWFTADTARKVAIALTQAADWIEQRKSPHWDID